MLYENELNAVLQETMQRWDIPGLGVGLVENGEITYVRGFGLQSLATHTPVTPNSIFCVASITKCFVATAVMQLVEQGVLQLDAPLVQYLPEFRLDDERYRQITLRQILSHTSGMPDSDEAEYEELIAHPEYDEGAPERYVHALVSHKMVAAPGERFAYSNIAYNVLGYLIARISGQTFEDYMKEHVLGPAGMPSSALSQLAISPRSAVRTAPAYPGHDGQPGLSVPPGGCPGQLPACLCAGDVQLVHHLPQRGFGDGQIFALPGQLRLDVDAGCRLGLSTVL